VQFMLLAGGGLVIGRDPDVNGVVHKVMFLRTPMSDTEPSETFRNWASNFVAFGGGF
jgi:hypothetical protein